MSEEELGFVRLQLEAVAAERDELQARIDAYEGNVERWEEMRALIKASSLGTPGAESLADRTPEGVGRAITLGAQYLARAEAAEAERDRLRAVVDDVDLQAARDAVTHLEATIAERDRLRAVVAKVQRLWHERGEVQATEELDQAAFAEWRAAWDEFLALDVSEVMGGMTPEEAHDFYADPANQEPTGPPVRRSGGVRQPDSPITVMDDTTHRPIEG